MIKIGPNDKCPCGVGRKYKKCCGPLHRGVRPPASPEALMRSRYTAYALGLVDYVIDTTHPDHPAWNADRATWGAELETWCNEADFIGLTVHGSGEEADTGWVSFTADYNNEGRKGALAELSRFERIDGRWLYRDKDS
jgi:SEC-C motif domain protein